MTQTGKNTMPFYCPDPADIEDLRIEARAAKHVTRQLLNHPDTQDPDCPELPDDDETEPTGD